MKSINCILIILLPCSFFSCWRTEQTVQYKYKQSDFFFRIPENDIGITCSKRTGAEFYVMFSKDSVQLSDSVDYLKYETGECDLDLIFTLQNKNNVYILDSRCLKDVNFVHYNLQVLDKSDFFSSQFFEIDTTVYPNQRYIKHPFVLVSIATRPYGIYLRNHDGDSKLIKRGDIHGGW